VRIGSIVKYRGNVQIEGWKSEDGGERKCEKEKRKAKGQALVATRQLIVATKRLIEV
jgi:hypothetical protein